MKNKLVKLKKPQKGRTSQSYNSRNSMDKVNLELRKMQFKAQRNSTVDKIILTAAERAKINRETNEDFRISLRRKKSKV